MATLTNLIPPSSSFCCSVSAPPSSSHRSPSLLLHRSCSCCGSRILPYRLSFSKPRSCSSSAIRESCASGFTRNVFASEIALVGRRRRSASFGGGRVLELGKGGRGSGFVLAAASSAAAAAPAGTEELPAKLQEIVRLFQQVADPRAKYEQLLYYAKQLRPLGKEFCTNENKVEGCVSQVWVRPTLNVEESTVAFEADSDSLLTKGLAALLVEGLSGASVAEVLKVNPEFIQMLGLKQSLTPSRSNGFLNMLKLMQKKTLQMYMAAEAGKSSSVGSAREYSTEARSSVAQVNGVETEVDSGASKNGTNFGFGGAPEQRSMKSSIEKKLQEALAPVVLVVDDVSHQHAGHAGVHKDAKETHFNVKVVSDKFTGNSLIKRHRLIYDLLDDELKNGVHALSLVTKSPSEPV